MPGQVESDSIFFVPSYNSKDLGRILGKSQSSPRRGINLRRTKGPSSNTHIPAAGPRRQAKAIDTLREHFVHYYGGTFGAFGSI